MTLAPDYALAPRSYPELSDHLPPPPSVIGRTVLRALDGPLIDIASLRSGEQVNGLVAVEDRQHYVRITEARRPPVTADGHTVVMLPGFTEMIDRGSGGNLHSAVAEHFPASRVISIATDGVGPSGQALGWRAGWRRDFDTMAADRLTLTEALAAPGPITMVNVSMGSVIGLRLALHNLRQPRVQLEHIINHSHAQVPPGRVPQDIVLRFLPHIARDGLREGARHPANVTRAALGSLALLMSHAPAYAGNLRQLLHGIDPVEVFQVAAAVPTTFISGATDPLAQRQRLTHLQTTLPETVRVVWLPGKGHASCLDTATTARDIAAADQHAT